MLAKKGLYDYVQLTIFPYHGFHFIRSGEGEEVEVGLCAELLGKVTTRIPSIVCSTEEREKYAKMKGGREGGRGEREGERGGGREGGREGRR